jgi:DNA-binding transcriptional LysR family regulator
MISGPVRAVANDPEAQLAMLLSAGDGIALLPLFLAAPLVREGRLRQVLEDWRTPDVPFYSVMPPGRGAVPAVRAIIDRLHQRLRQPDAWVSTEAAD